ncbi:PD-(D/E)XK nuclease family protein [Verrucomicrobiaceae bacterium 227]
MLPTLEFLSSGEPYGTEVIAWLWARKESLPETMVIVPTAQSSRRMRQGLAELGGVLAPRVVTAGSLLQAGDFAPASVEILAWTEELESVSDWSSYEAIFPTSPLEDTAGWALGLARSFHDLRKSLQENALMLREAARLVDPLEVERWGQLARLEEGVERRLKEWGYQSKSALLAGGEVAIPSGVKQVVVAGVFDLPPVLSKAFEASDAEIVVLLPEGEAEQFDAWGRPALTWNEIQISWPERGSVTLTGDPRQQADLAVNLVAAAESDSEEVGLGTGDEEVSAELVRSFGRAGWIIHDPGASLPSPVSGWLGCWRRYLTTPGVKEVIDLLSFDQGRALVRGLRSMQVTALSQLRDAFLSRSLEDVQRARAIIERNLESSTSESKTKRLDHQLKSAVLAEEVMTEFETLRKRFLGQGFHSGMRGLLARIDREGESGLEEWIEATASAAERVQRSPTFWIDLLLADLGPVSESAPEGRALDVQGWLELLHDPAPHLIVCGMNEGRIPARASSDTWLPENARLTLGLPCDKTRSARDAFLLHALLKMREDNGRVDLIVGKTSQGGDVLMPSRLLLTAKGKELAGHVRALFAEVEPPDSGVAWTLEDHWKWTPRCVEPRAKMSVTAFSKYLACPFRYYLESVVGMSEPEPERAEWNHRDFGSIMHDVLEQWGRDPVARDSTEAAEIEAWTLKELDDLVERYFGDTLPLAVSLQVEAMRLRLGWFAEVQAKTRRDGWRIIKVEEDFVLEIEGVSVTGQVDRIDEHENGEIRVLDYKTTKTATEVEKAHKKTFRNDPPDHLRNPHVLAPDGKTWTNLQVPFYAAALGKVDAAGYFALGENAANVKIMNWDGFGEEEKASALECAGWIVKQVQEEVFWPPAEKVKYDDFESLAYGRPLADSVMWEGGVA